ncbi:sulfite exporter TauE/SafE family protein [Rapidithrix thailandica]|uniref:Probable membrane transporter protein n=1 Tax=Rapidithrix thailandica TaxID=413964 RepID=A0AAW9SFM2_9BACT
MEFTWTYFFMLIAGFLAGIVNSLAGSGSVFTLSVLLFAGMPANIANATNRLGIIVQSFTSLTIFKKNEQLPVEKSWKYLIPSVGGAMIGAWVAVDIDRQLLERIIGYVMAFLLVILIFEPKKYLKNQSSKTSTYVWVEWMAFFGIGFYGGFIQAGIGVLILVGLVSISQMSFVQANAIKVLVIFIYTLPVFGLFIYYDQIDWWAGIWLSIGQFLGSMIASYFAVKNPNANAWIKYLLIFMIALTILKMFGWLDFGISS